MIHNFSHVIASSSPRRRMMRPKFFEGCGREGPIRCIFLCEFHPIAGPKITCQVPQDYISKDGFESVSVYIIPKTQLFANVITITVFDFKILGFPARIDDKKYARNAYCFNLCFVFDYWARSIHYEPVVRKLTEYLKFMEIEGEFLSRLDYSQVHKERLASTLFQVMSDLNAQKVCVLTGTHMTTHLKVMPILQDPSPVLDYQVPVFIDSGNAFQSDQWDLTTNQILPYVNGVNHVTKISASADVDNNLVKSCLQNLVYYGVICMIPIFQYSNMYAVTPKLKKITSDTKLQKECIATVSRMGKHSANFRDIFSFYSNMRNGVTMKDLCVRFNPVELRIDERNLVQFGIIEGFIRRIYQYPILTECAAASDIPLSQYFTGEYSTDHICCINETSFNQLEEIIANNPTVTFICK